jgi:spore coat protein CotF
MLEIKYHKDVLLYLNELVDILIDKGYFSFYDVAAQYMEDLVNYVKKNIATK